MGSEFEIQEADKIAVKEKGQLSAGGDEGFKPCQISEETDLS